MTTYIDPTTELPQNLGEIYSDRNIRIVGQARINPSVANQIDTIGIKVLCTPQTGGDEGVSAITSPASYALSGTGSSLWVKITRAGTVTVTPEIYAAGAQPKSRKDYVQVFYQTSANQIVSISSFLIYPGPLYTRLGYGVGQKIYDAIVGNSGDDHVTHTDLQTAINDTATNGWILVKKMCSITTTLNTNSKSIKFVFEGYGTGIQAGVPNPGTGIIFGAAGCQLVGFGQLGGAGILGFTTYAVNLGTFIGARIDMVFSGNTANINTTGLNGTQYSVNGSYGLTETSHIQTSSVHGTVSRWNHNTSKRWEPVLGITVDDSGNTTSTGTIQGTTITGTTQLRATLAGSGISLFLSAVGMATVQISHVSATIARLALAGNGQTLQIGDGNNTGVVAITNTTASSNTTSGALVVSGGVGVTGAINASGTITGNIVIGAVYN